MKDQFTQDREAACKWAYELLQRTNWCVLDTETTALDGVAVEISAIAPDGTVLFDKLINPDGMPIHPKARAAHKITDEELAKAPKLPEIWGQLCQALAPYTTIITYNAPFDKSILERHAKLYNLAPLTQRWECAMQRYAEYYGDWNDYYESYRWQPLNGGHRALQDCQAALKRIHEMASFHVPALGIVEQPGSAASFRASIPVHAMEAAYLVKALTNEMPRGKQVPPNIFQQEDVFAGRTLVCIDTPEPLSLHQRRFLVACGFNFEVSEVRR